MITFTCCYVDVRFTGYKPTSAGLPYRGFSGPPENALCLWCDSRWNIHLKKTQHFLFRSTFDRNTNSSYLLSCISLNVSFENLVVQQDNILLMIAFFILITSLPDMIRRKNLLITLKASRYKPSQKFQHTLARRM